jgi:hypothetical protein
VNRSSGAIKSGGRNKHLVKVENVSLEGISIINLNHYVIILFYIDAKFSGAEDNKHSPCSTNQRRHFMEYLFMECQFMECHFMEFWFMEMTLFAPGHGMTWFMEYSIH